MDKKILEQLLQQQNKLLEQNNKLLENQNRLLQKSPTIREEFVENILQDEFRSGFLVTSHRKKLWNVQIGLINEFARICKKHNLKWFAYGGTLLGAVRHKGFIPWDDDVDLAMLRPDYEKFKRIAAEEIHYPYFLDDWCNVRLESDETPVSMPNLPFISRKQENFYFRRGFFPSFPVMKLRDCRTTMIEIPDRKDANQGIWIDIFPLDCVPPFAEDKKSMFHVASDLLIATVCPSDIKKAISEGKKFAVQRDDLQKFLKLPYRQKALTWEKFMFDNNFKSPKVGQFRQHCLQKIFKTNARKNLEKTVLLPFEKIEIFAPKGYEEFLQEYYGDWRKLVFSPGHTRDYFISADISYEEYAKKSALMK